MAPQRFTLEYREPGCDWQPMYGLYSEAAKNTAIRQHEAMGFEVRVFAARQLEKV